MLETVQAAVKEDGLGEAEELLGSSREVVPIGGVSMGRVTDRFGIGPIVKFARHFVIVLVSFLGGAAVVVRVETFFVGSVLLLCG